MADNATGTVLATTPDTGLIVLPRRWQYRRLKGWRFPEGAIYVGRARAERGKYGNPIRWEDFPAVVAATDLGDRVAARRIADANRRQLATDEFEDRVRQGTLPDYPTVADIRRELAGKDVVCWCPLDGACHGDVLIRIANEPATTFTPVHWAVLGRAFHGYPVEDTPNLIGVITDLANDGYLTHGRNITDGGRAHWMRNAPWGAYTAPLLTCRPTIQ